VWDVLIWHVLVGDALVWDVFVLDLLACDVLVYGLAGLKCKVLLTSLCATILM